VRNRVCATSCDPTWAVAPDSRILRIWRIWASTAPFRSRVRVAARMILPDGRFRDLWRALGARGHARDALERLRVAYDEPHRVYHTAAHIGACLRVLDDPLVRPLATRIEEVEAALWFHDAVYDTHASDNEEQSALLADEILRSAGVAVDVVARIATYIRATESHAAGSPDAKGRRRRGPVDSRRGSRCLRALRGRDPPRVRVGRRGIVRTRSRRRPPPLSGAPVHLRDELVSSAA
jgi:hypothetical protein